MKRLILIGMVCLGSSALAGLQHKKQFAVVNTEGYVTQHQKYDTRDGVPTFNLMDGDVAGHSGIDRLAEIIPMREGRTHVTELQGTDWVKVPFTQTKSVELLAIEVAFSNALQDVNGVIGTDHKKPAKGLEKEVRGKAGALEVGGQGLTTVQRRKLDRLENLGEALRQEYQRLGKPEWMYEEDDNGQSTVEFGKQVVNP